MPSLTTSATLCSVKLSGTHVHDSRIQSFSSLKSWAPLVAASVRGRRLGGKLCCQLVIGMQSSWWEHNPHKLTLRWLRRINFHVWWNQERLVTGVQCLFSLSLTFWVKWMPGCGKWPERLGHRLVSSHSSECNSDDENQSLQCGRSMHGAKGWLFAAV